MVGDLDAGGDCVIGFTRRRTRIMENKKEIIAPQQKTPTKEQIIKIHRSNQHLMSLSHYTIGLIITEWEKIKNS